MFWLQIVVLVVLVGVAIWLPFWGRRMLRRELDRAVFPLYHRLRELEDKDKDEAI